jgi:hypothetical protein
MTRYTNVFAHFARISISSYRVKYRPGNGLQGILLNFNPAVKLLLNWKKDQGTRVKAQNSRFKAQGSRVKAQEFKI